jgi:hypothetical protein
LRKFNIAWVDKDVQYHASIPETEDEDVPVDDDIDSYNQDPGKKMIEHHVHTAQAHCAKDMFSEVFDMGTREEDDMVPVPDIPSYTFSNAARPIYSQAEEEVLAIGRVHVDSPDTPDAERQADVQYLCTI